MPWTRGVPDKPGWYWFRNTTILDESVPRILELRDYAGRIALGNCYLKGFSRFEQGEWQPVQGPME